MTNSYARVTRNVTLLIQTAAVIIFQLAHTSHLQVYWGQVGLAEAAQGINTRH